MKSFIVALCLFAVAAADDKTSQVLRSDYQQSPEGNYNFAFENDNGISGQAAGVLKQLGKDEVAFEVTGQNQYRSPEGEIIQTSYVANEKGYQPQGAHLPTPPPPQPIPDYILRSLEFIKAHPYVERKQ